jgi:hypothetical protein
MRAAIPHGVHLHVHAYVQACVEVGKVSGLMCSYNAVNGVPSVSSAPNLLYTTHNDDGTRGGWRKQRITINATFAVRERLAAEGYRSGRVAI